MLHMQAQEAARQAAQATAIMDDDFDLFNLMVMIFAQSQEAATSMAIEDAQQFHEMQLRIHAQDMADAAAKRQRDAIAMVENTHQRNPFDDGGATLALMNRGTTASAPQIMQFAIEDRAQRFNTMAWTSSHHQARVGWNFPSQHRFRLPPSPPRLLALPPPPVPFSFDSAQAKRARVDASNCPIQPPCGSLISWD